jgi:hypothetical protein
VTGLELGAPAPGAFGTEPDSVDLRITHSQDPVTFSYRLGANLPLSDEERQRLLSVDSLVLRWVRKLQGDRKVTLRL